jgi:uncharacterized membrane protein
MSAVGSLGGAEAGPAIIVLSVIVLGATIYLWTAKYIRRSTAILLVLFCLIVLVSIGTWMYLHPMRDFVV